MDIKIETVPVPKGRPKFTRNGRTYTPKKTADYEDLVKAEWIKKYGCEPLEGAIDMTIVFYMPIPKSAPKYKREQMLTGQTLHTKKPDLDNLVKAILDALNGVAYKDDSQVVQLRTTKLYSDKPMVWFEIRPAYGMDKGYLDTLKRMQR